MRCAGRDRQSTVPAGAPHLQSVWREHRDGGAADRLPDNGTTVDQDRAFALLDRFVDVGGEWLDSANCYAFWSDPAGVGGASERVIGARLQARPGGRA
ncbi:Aldo/keto reductase family protein [Micromonospora matsumotoense]|uniref:Aldo/keto reductase family protein n=1 Tax=Micromonospora matsumotoense TaxID=121616 RepID=A0A1C5A3S1_9ACTN|nr:Aldo/keto reductase family protein [Micromonospora matsumotoense]